MAETRATRWPVALRAGLAVSLPVVAFTIVAQPTLGLIAGLGAFTSLYAASATARDRSKVVAVVAAAFVLCGIAGVAASGSRILIAVGLIVVAAAAVVMAHGSRLGPPGPVFFVLVYGASAHIETPAAGHRALAPWLFIALLASGCALAYLLAISPLLPRSARRELAHPLRELLPRPSFNAASRTVITRSMIVVGSGAAIAGFVDSSRGYWVVCAGLAVLGTGLPRAATLRRAIERVGGTLGGVLVFIGVAALAPSGLLLALILGVLQTIVELFVVRAYGIALVFITPLALTVALAASTHKDPLAFGQERFIDTVIGTAVAVIATLAVTTPATRTKKKVLED